MEIQILKKTPSINHLYGQRGFRKFLTKEGKELRNYIVNRVYEQINVDEVNLLKDKKLMVEVRIHENWITQKGITARKDIANREKFLIDSVFGALLLDDKFIWDHTMIKVQDENKEKAIIRIKEI